MHIIIPKINTEKTIVTNPPIIRPTWGASFSPRIKLATELAKPKQTKTARKILEKWTKNTLKFRNRKILWCNRFKEIFRFKSGEISTVSVHFDEKIFWWFAALKISIFSQVFMDIQNGFQFHEIFTQRAFFGQWKIWQNVLCDNWPLWIQNYKSKLFGLTSKRCLFPRIFLGVKSDTRTWHPSHKQATILDSQRKQ